MQTEKLVEMVLTRLDLQGHECVLYSGVGLFTVFLVERAREVTAIEIFPAAVQDALANLDGFDNVTLIEGTIAEGLRELQGRFDAAVIDPPRGDGYESAGWTGEKV